MPRKPSSIFLLVEQPSDTAVTVGMPATADMPASTLQAWRLPLAGDESPEELIERHLESQSLGAVLYWVEDTKVEARRVGLTLQEIEDARLGDAE